MAASGAELPRPLRGDGSGFEGTFAFRCYSYQAGEAWGSRPRPLIAAFLTPEFCPVLSDEGTRCGAKPEPGTASAVAQRRTASFTSVWAKSSPLKSSVER